MRKVIAALNLTIDGFCDHTAGIADEELHQHYTELINEADHILYGRITYQLMEYWRTLLENPSEEKSMNDFAQAINKIEKIVFSHTLHDVDWESARLSNKKIEEELLELKKSTSGGDKDILIGSRSMIIHLMNLNLIDEYQLCVHPVVIGGGLPLFDKINNRTVLKLTNTKTFGSGAIILYYEPLERN